MGAPIKCDCESDARDQLFGTATAVLAGTASAPCNRSAIAPTSSSVPLFSLLEGNASEPGGLRCAREPRGICVCNLLALLEAVTER